MFSTGKLPKLKVPLQNTRPSIPSKDPITDQPSRCFAAAVRVSQSCQERKDSLSARDPTKAIKIATYDLSGIQKRPPAKYSRQPDHLSPPLPPATKPKPNKEKKKTTAKRRGIFPGIDPNKLGVCGAARSFMMPANRWMLKATMFRDLEKSHVHPTRFKPKVFTGYKGPGECVCEKDDEEERRKSKKSDKFDDPLRWAPLSVRRLFYGPEPPGVPPRSSKVKLQFVDNKRLYPGAPINTSAQRALQNSLLIVYLFELENMEEEITKNWDNIGNLKGIARMIVYLQDRINTLTSKVAGRLDALNEQYVSGASVQLSPCRKPAPTLLQPSHPGSAPYPKGLIVNRPTGDTVRSDFCLAPEKNKDGSPTEKSPAENTGKDSASVPVLDGEGAKLSGEVSWDTMRGERVQVEERAFGGRETPATAPLSPDAGARMLTTDSKNQQAKRESNTSMDTARGALDIVATSPKPSNAGIQKGDESVA